MINYSYFFFVSQKYSENVVNTNILWKSFDPVKNLIRRLISIPLVVAKCFNPSLKKWGRIDGSAKEGLTLFLVSAVRLCQFDN